MPHQRNSEQGSGDSNPPMELKRTTKFAAPLYLILSFTGAVALAYAAWDSQKTSIANHEERIVKLEATASSINVMQNDISWIRRSIETRSNGMPRTESNPGGH